MLAAALVSISFVFGCAKPPSKGAASTPGSDERTEPESTIGQLAPGEPPSVLAVEADDPAWGAPDAKVTIVAFLDYQCAFCAQGFKTLLALRGEYAESDLRIVFKHLPLEFHELAIPAAIAGQAVMQGAGSQAFFEFSRQAFEGQSRLDYATLAEWADEAGLPRELYDELVAREDTVFRVAQDARRAAFAGVDATPAFFINGRLLAGAQPREVFQQMIFEELREMNELLDGEKKLAWKAAYQARIADNMGESIVSALLAQDPHDYRVPVDGSPVWGSKDAAVTIVMFTDFECPFCKRAEATLDQIRKKYPGDVRIVFKHLPLDFHDRALPAALLAAAVQKYRGDEAFFAAASEVFERSPDLSEATLGEIGRSHGLSASQVSAALSGEDEEVNERVRRDMELSSDVQARGTPHFFVNGKRLTGARPLEQFDALISHGLDRARALVAEGIAPRDVYETLQKDAHSPGLPEKLTEEIPSEKRPSKGPADAPIVVHVFSDFECPYCREGEAGLEELAEEFPTTLRFVWHNFPLEFHERATPAARVAQLSFDEKGNSGFWKMHGLLFGLSAGGPALSDEQIRAHGKSLGLDMQKLEAALTGDLKQDIVENQMEIGAALGIRGTPAYVIGGYLVTGAKPLSYLERIVKMAEQDRATMSAEPAP